MRHRKSFNHLGRTSAHRSAMLANMAASLILHKRIETTTAKAKALRGYVEPIITKSKEDTTHSRRVVFSYLQNKEAVTELFREVAAKVHDRPGGYTRIFKVGTRLGDSADMCIIELVDFNEILLGETTTKAKPGRKRRGGRKKEQDTVVAPTVVTKPGIEKVTEMPEAEDQAVVINDTVQEAAPEASEAVSSEIIDEPELTEVDDKPASFSEIEPEAVKEEEAEVAKEIEAVKEAEPEEAEESEAVKETEPVDDKKTD